MQSKYCYSGTDVLINKFNVRDQDQLDVYETAYTHKRISELGIKPLYGKFNLSHLTKIHTYIFQDLYNFAGTLRSENISKGFFSFADARYLESEAKVLFENLKKENYLKGLDHNTFSERAAHYLAEINVLHPFREGNGRTQRELIRTLGLNAGYQIDWSKVTKEQLLNATIKSVVDTKELEQIMGKVVVNQEPNKHLIRFYKNQDNSRKRELFLER